MNKVWKLYPADRAAYICCLTEICPALDRAGVEFHVADIGEAIAKAIILADGKEFVPEPNHD